MSYSESIDAILRPGKWDEYVGQENIKKNLRVIIEAAQKRGEAMDHLLFAGPAGLGKTTMAHLVANEVDAKLQVTSGPALEKAGDLAALLTNLEPNEILFIDEAHRINRLIEEVLYPAMEARKLHLMVGKGPSARSLNVDLPPFTLIAATTRENMLSRPLRTRFGATFRLEYYSPEHIKQIIDRSARILETEADADALDTLAHASRSTPRVANRLLKRARDFMQVRNKEKIDKELAQETLELLEIDEKGLEPHDRRLLKIIIEKFDGGPVGVGTLAAALSEEKGVIEEIYEPHLMSLGFIKRTPQGRVVLPAAYRHLSLDPPGAVSGSDLGGLKQQGDML